MDQKLAKQPNQQKSINYIQVLFHYDNSSNIGTKLSYNVNISSNVLNTVFWYW